MKKIVVIMILVLLALSTNRAVAAQQSTFVEEPMPKGKAIIYVYTNWSAPITPEGWGNLVVLADTGAFTVLAGSTYCTIVTDPSSLELLFIVVVGSSPKSRAKKFVVDAAAGQSYFISFDGNDVSLVPPEKAKKDNAILKCRKVE